jgi:CHAD domain-containing protein
VSNRRVVLDPRLPPGQAARGAALALLDDALARLREGGARGVHETRRDCKQLRALLRLLKAQLGARYAAANAGVRDASRALSARREADVLAETAEALFGRDARLRPLARLLRAPANADRGALRAARRRLQAERERIAAWRLPGLAAGQVPDGLQHTWRRARQAFRAARRRSQPAALHEWRKQAKYHRNQLALVAPLWPQGRARLRGLDTLSDLLGWHHDLLLLDLALARLPAGVASPKQRARARARIGDEQARAAAAALELGRVLFAGRVPDRLEMARA